MIEPSTWQKFFAVEAATYLQERFTKATDAEIPFLLDLLALLPGASILDMGCGVGRHAVPLAQRGFSVTGVDLSPAMLAQARQRADAAGVTLTLVQANATEFTAADRFDAAICLCEGGFGLLNPGEDGDIHDLAILRSIAAALKPGAPFVLTALNGYRAIRQMTQADVDSGRFDPLTLTQNSEVILDTPTGPETLTLREKKHLPQDLARLCREAGFSVDHLWGGTAGNWGRRPVDLDEMEVMVVARARPPA